MANMKKENLTFRQLYLNQKSKERTEQTPVQAFISEIAKITKKSENTVRGWAAGRQPEELEKSIISEHLGIDKDILFPKNE